MANPILTLGSISDMVHKLQSDIRKLFRLNSQSPPTGALFQFVTAVQQDGFLKCDGSIYNIADYPDLGAMCGSTFGGNGTTTFGVPDFTGGKFMRGSVSAIGSSGGASTHSHPLSAAGYAQLTTDTTANQLRMAVIATGSYTSNRRQTATGNNVAAVTTASEAAGVALNGNTDAASSLPPYIDFPVQVKI